jgi:2-oxoglutarate dehydrogenase E1 component
MDQFSFVGNSDIEVIEQLYKQYLADPMSVDPGYRLFFKGFDFALQNFDGHKPSDGLMGREFLVINMIQGYRQRGHLFTATNPVRKRRKYFPTLDIGNFGLSESDLSTVFEAGNEIGIGPSRLDAIIEHLNATYCQSVGVEYLYMRDPDLIKWVQSKMEKERATPAFDRSKKLGILRLLKRAVGFEQFVHKKFVGQKRFSLEGSEVLIPALHALIEKGAMLNIEEFVFGMPHRGRLNVLANILKKPYRNIFKEFEGDEYEADISLGDVKYHLGYDNSFVTECGKRMRISMVPNPSHLETVGPVVEGISRSLIDNKYAGDSGKLVPVVIHGDAAIASQGVVYEVVQMSQLPGYKTGGTIHIVINNQVGFTTNYLDGRSSTYCTDIAKVNRCPVFHVNGDDVEAMVYTIEMALEFRNRFQMDVFIDILSYRKYGHNEGDEPRFTQPTLYSAIARHPNPRDIYAERLIKEGVISKDEFTRLIADFDMELEEELVQARKIDKVYIQRFHGDLWKKFRFPVSSDFEESSTLEMSKDKLLQILDRINHLPEDKQFFKKAVKIVEDRREMVRQGNLDWALGELLAYGVLVDSGVPVRLSGQDSVRGTFAHRHAAFTIENNDEHYIPLQNIRDGQAPFTVYNSPLSEYGVLGFEYGYGLTKPDGLNLWEAQFGDFANVAQVIFDQYICSAQEKWGLMNGLVMLLPHGFEGQGPEHSSARMERYLQLAVRNNIQVVNCTTPANFFHLLQRHATRDIKVPLIVFTPKSLLRHPRCISSIDEFANGRFQEIIDDTDVDVEKVSRVVICTGKVYFDILKRKEELGARDVAIIRMEQIHPYPRKQIKAIIKKYTSAKIYLWVQEEPENMGALSYVRSQAGDFDFLAVARLASGSPSTGLSGLHHIGQEEIVDKVFKKCNCELKNDYCALQCTEGKSRKEILKEYKNYPEPYRFTM